jgi:DNA-directed RNA polymerase specialized sigma24 family protein
LKALLARLAADPDSAGQAFESLRHALTRFFDWRGAVHADECADETLNRLAKKLEEGEAVVDVRSYALAIARFVWLEEARSPVIATRPLAEALAAVAVETPAEDLLLEDCIDRCLDAQEAGGRALILRYYAHERGRKIQHRAALAAELGISANALRSRVQRLRDRLESCVRRCAGLASASWGSGPT